MEDIVFIGLVSTTIDNSNIACSGGDPAFAVIFSVVFIIVFFVVLLILSNLEFLDKDSDDNYCKINNYSDYCESNKNDDKITNDINYLIQYVNDFYKRRK